jgi:sterol desaturase/sphingolipid hydroxylase (fatty acid hydroxylase superfamily)
MDNQAYSSFTFAFTSTLVRYLCFAGVAFVIFHVLLRRRILHKKIQQTYPRGSDYVREIAYSLLTCVIFGVVATVVFSPVVRPFTRLYLEIAEHGWTYLFASIPLMIFIHDAYFYWMHRFMHWKPVYRAIHVVHHRSRNPSPWAALAFHPLEALLEAGLLVPLALVMPVHPVALLIFFLWTTFFNVGGHMGFEVYPRWLTESRWGRWLNTSTNHNLHHQNPHGNYGLFFRFWDEWMGTTHESYEEALHEVQDRKPQPHP